MQKNKYKYGYMCMTDFNWELGEAAPYTEVYPSVKTLKKERDCCGKDGACGIVKVKVVLENIIRERDFNREK